MLYILSCSLVAGGTGEPFRGFLLDVGEDHRRRRPEVLHMWQADRSYPNDPSVDKVSGAVAVHRRLATN